MVVPGGLRELNYLPQSGWEGGQADLLSSDRFLSQKFPAVTHYSDSIYLDIIPSILK